MQATPCGISWDTPTSWNMSSDTSSITKDLLDPTRLWVPETMVVKAQKEYEAPIVRAGTTHAEALIDFLRSPQAVGATCPPGFATAQGSRVGLPACIKRVPGQGLSLARDIRDAFTSKSSADGSLLGKVRIESVTPREQLPINEQKIFDASVERYKSLADGDVWRAAVLAEEAALEAKRIEKATNEECGLPYTTEPQDTFDAEGREYGKRVEAAVDWNRPSLPVVYETAPDGGWMSLATVECEVISERLKQKEALSAGEWEVVGKGKRGRGGR